MHASFFNPISLSRKNCTIDPGKRKKEYIHSLKRILWMGVLQISILMISGNSNAQINDAGTLGVDTHVIGYLKLFTKEIIQSRDTVITADFTYGRGANSMGGRKITITTKSVGYLENGDSSEYTKEDTYFEDPQKDTPQKDLKISYPDGITIKYTSIKIKDGKGTTTETVTNTVTGPLGEDLFYQKGVSSRNSNTGQYTERGTRKYVDKQGKTHSENYNSKTNKWEDTGNLSLPQDNLASAGPNPELTNLSFHSNEALVGVAYMDIGNSGKGSNGYGSFGVTGEYTHYINPKVGATLNFGVYFHKETQDEYSVNYSQFNVYAGVTYVPCKNPERENKMFSGNLHGLIGLSSLTVKESSGSYGLDQLTKQSLTFALGGALEYHISPRFRIRLQADYTPTFYFNTTQNNFRIGIGPTIKF
jgi:hypothetical protein